MEKMKVANLSHFRDNEKVGKSLLLTEEKNLIKNEAIPDYQFIKKFREELKLKFED